MNAIVCEAPATVKVCATGAGAAQLGVAAWLAVTEHCPVVKRVRVAPTVGAVFASPGVLPLVVQTEAVLELKVIVPVEVEVATSVMGVGLTATLLN